MLLFPLAAAVPGPAMVLSGLPVAVPPLAGGDFVFSFVLSFSFSFSLDEPRVEEVLEVLEAVGVLELLELLEVLEMLEALEALLVLALLERPVGVGVVDLPLEREPEGDRRGEGTGMGG